MKRTEQRRMQASPTPEMQMDRTRVVVLQHGTKGCGEMRAAEKNKHWTWSINHISDAVLLMRQTGTLKKVTLLLIERIKEDAFGRTVCNNTSLSSLSYLSLLHPLVSKICWVQVFSLLDLCCGLTLAELWSKPLLKFADAFGYCCCLL